VFHDPLGGHFTHVFPTTGSTGTQVHAITGFPNRIFSSTAILGAISTMPGSSKILASS